MKIKFLIIICILPLSILYAQDIKLSKNAIKKVFKNSVENYSKKYMGDKSSPLIADNTDSLFYKSDTVTLYDNHGISYSLGFCEIIDIFSFHKWNTPVIGKSQHCIEPSSGKVLSEKDYFNLSILKKKDKYFLLFKNDFGKSYTFEVIRISKIDYGNTKAIVLKRIND